MRRRTVTMLAVALTVVFVTGGIALAAAFTGTTGDDRIKGTPAADAIDGRAGDDTIFGGRGGDAITGGRGRDFIVGGPRGERGRDSIKGNRGNDRIRTFNRPAAADAVDCGLGFDRVVVDARDAVRNCERVIRR